MVGAAESVCPGGTQNLRFSFIPTGAQVAAAVAADRVRAQPNYRMKLTGRGHRFSRGLARPALPGRACRPSRGPAAYAGSLGGYPGFGAAVSSPGFAGGRVPGASRWPPPRPAGPRDPRSHARDMDGRRPGLSSLPAGCRPRRTTTRPPNRRMDLPERDRRWQLPTASRAAAPQVMRIMLRWRWRIQYACHSHRSGCPPSLLSPMWPTPRCFSDWQGR